MYIDTHICLYLFIYLPIYLSIYICIERERVKEGERESVAAATPPGPAQCLTHAKSQRERARLMTCRHAGHSLAPDLYCMLKSEYCMFKSVAGYDAPKRGS